jgi:hypothetical protein
MNTGLAVVGNSGNVHTEHLLAIEPLEYPGDIPMETARPVSASTAERKDDDEL